MSTSAREREAAVASTTAFSAIALRELARPILPQHPRIESLLSPLPTGQVVADAYERAYAHLRNHYRNEYVYKNSLVSKIIFGRHSPRTATALLEVPMGTSCADVVILNGTITTYEIKTDLDQLSRLSSQLHDYCTRTEHVNVVSSPARAAAVERVIPEYVGIIELRKDGSLGTLRPSGSNLERLNADHLFLLLRTSEASRVLSRMTGKQITGPAGQVWPVLRRETGKLDPMKLHGQVLIELRRRQQRAAQLVANPAYPQSLRALGYTLNLSSAAAGRLLDRLCEKHPPSY